jgi:hypothetical protein
MEDSESMETNLPVHVRFKDRLICLLAQDPPMMNPNHGSSFARCLTIIGGWIYIKLPSLCRSYFSTIPLLDKRRRPLNLYQTVNAYTTPRLQYNRGEIHLLSIWEYISWRYLKHRRMSGAASWMKPGICAARRAEPLRIIMHPVSGQKRHWKRGSRRNNDEVKEAADCLIYFSARGNLIHSIMWVRANNV